MNSGRGARGGGGRGGGWLVGCYFTYIFPPVEFCLNVDLPVSIFLENVICYNKHPARLGKNVLFIFFSFFKFIRICIHFETKAFCSFFLPVLFLQIVSLCFI